VPNTDLGLTYPDNTGSTQLWTHWQNLATTTNALWSPLLVSRATDTTTASLTNTVIGFWTPAAWTIASGAVTRGGILRAQFILDCNLASGAGAGYININVNGVDSQTRTKYLQLREEIIVVSDPVKVVAGVAIAMQVKIGVFSGSGALTINSHKWVGDIT
jgi:hypothetical protein